MKYLNGNIVIGDFYEGSKIGNDNIIISSEEFLKIINESNNRIVIGSGAEIVDITE